MLLDLDIVLEKYDIVPVGDAEILACILGCKVCSLPMKYLGASYKATYLLPTYFFILCALGIDL